MRKWLPWLALGIVVVVAVGVLVARSGPSSEPEARARRLERRLACPICTGESLAASNSPEARAARTDIRERIAAGESDRQIVDAYALVYGERIVLNPKGDGLGLIAWGVPVVALILGGAGIAIAVRRWTSQPRLDATAEDEDLVRHARDGNDDD